MRTLIDDVRLALRLLRRRPFLTVVSGLCLALGIGVNAGVYSVMHAALYRPLPFGAPERLVLVSTTSDTPGTFLGAVSPDTYEFHRAEAGLFTALGAAANAEFDLGGEGVPERWPGARVTPDFFDVLGVALTGPGFSAAGDLREAVLSDRIWRTRFGADPSIVGTDLRLDGLAVRVVGLAPPDARYPATADIWVPNDIAAYSGTNRTNGFLTVVGRLADGVPRSAAADEIVRLGEVYLERTPNWISSGLAASDLRAVQVRQARSVLLILMVSVSVVLLMGCINAMSLYLLEADREARTTALRMALGASGGRLVRQQGLRFVLLSAGASLVGTAAGVPVARALIPASAIDVPGFAVAIDAQVLLFAALAALVAALLVGTLPTLAAVRTTPDRLLARRGATSGRGARRRQMGVVVVQLALSLVLCVSAWSMTSHLGRLLTADPGFRVDDILTARIGASRVRYPTLEARSQFFGEVLDRLRAIPGVASAGAAAAAPLGDPDVFWSFSIEDQPPANSADQHGALGRMTLPGYLETLDIAVLEGRALAPTDDGDAEPVVLVNRTFAETYWPGQSAVGRRIKRRTYDSPFPWLRIVGVVESVRERDLGDDYLPTIYFSHPQHDTPSGETMTLVLRTDNAPPDLANRIRELVAGLDRDAAVFRTLTMAERLEESTGQRRLGGVLLGAFGAVGLALSLVGVYGVISAGVTERRREFGVRLALGDTPGGIARTTVRHALVLAGGGVALGALALALVIEPARQLLPGLDTDATTVTVTAAVLLSATVLAAVRPAWRAGHTDAARALTED